MRYFRNFSLYKDERVEYYYRTDDFGNHLHILKDFGWERCVYLTNLLEFGHYLNSVGGYVEELTSEEFEIILFEREFMRELIS